MRRIALSLGLLASWALFGGVAGAQVRSHVVAGGTERADILVSLVSQTGRIVHQVFTGARGQFQLEGVSVLTLRSNEPMYIVIDEEGYKPYRQRLLQADLRSGGTSFAIFLEEDAPPPPDADARNGTVDVRQLQAQIPRAARDAYQDALRAIEAGEATDAIARLERAVERAPDYYDAWLELGNQYDRQGRRDDAAHAYLRATEVDPGGALAHLNLGAICYQRADEKRVGGETSRPDFEQARTWLGQAVRLDPTSAAAGFFLGATLYRLDDYGGSEEWLLRAVSMDGGYRAGARSMLINVYSRQGRYRAALDQALAFLRDFPDDPGRETVERVKTQLESALGI